MQLQVGCSIVVQSDNGIGRIDSAIRFYHSLLHTFTEAAQLEA